MSKNKVIIGIASALVIIIGIIIAILLALPKTFSLSSEYYHRGEIFQNVTVADLEKLIDEQKSFAVFIYQPGCKTSEDFEQIVGDYSQEHEITFLRTAFVELKKSGLIPDLKYYPSMALYHDGELVTFLRADSDEDVQIYQNAEDFAAWWQKYIKNP